MVVVVELKLQSVRFACGIYRDRYPDSPGKTKAFLLLMATFFSFIFFSLVFFPYLSTLTVTLLRWRFLTFCPKSLNYMQSLCYALAVEERPLIVYSFSPATEEGQDNDLTI